MDDYYLIIHLLDKVSSITFKYISFPYKGCININQSKDIALWPSPWIHRYSNQRFLRTKFSTHVDARVVALILQCQGLNVEQILHFHKTIEVKRGFCDFLFVFLNVRTSLKCNFEWQFRYKCMAAGLRIYSGFV